MQTKKGTKDTNDTKDTKETLFDATFGRILDK
jgi:hypothetical protein